MALTKVNNSVLLLWQQLLMVSVFFVTLNSAEETCPINRNGRVYFKECNDYCCESKSNRYCCSDCSKSYYSKDTCVSMLTAGRVIGFSFAVLLGVAFLSSESLGQCDT